MRVVEGVNVFARLLRHCAPGLVCAAKRLVHAITVSRQLKQAVVSETCPNFPRPRARVMFTGFQISVPTLDVSAAFQIFWVFQLFWKFGLGFERFDSFEYCFTT